MPTTKTTPRKPPRKTSGSTSASASAITTPRPRKARAGDTIGVSKPSQVKQAVSRKATKAAQGAQIAAIKDIVHKTDDKALALKTFLKGSSPEDIEEVRTLLSVGASGGLNINASADEELARDWRNGAYRRRPLNRHQVRLQEAGTAQCHAL